MKRYGLLGKNIKYSLSPAMHNAAFEHFGINAEYVLFDKEESELDDFLLKDMVSDRVVSGINITIPYKIKVKEFLERKGYELKDWAKKSGAINTIKLEQNKLVGFNTDIFGFHDAVWIDLDLENETKLKEIRKVFIFGAGGAGRAISVFISYMGWRPMGNPKGNPRDIKQIKMFDIDISKLMLLNDDFKRLWGKHKPGVFHPIESEKDISEEIKDCDLVINATPVGASEKDGLPFDLNCLKKDALIYDLIYAKETEMVKYAKEKGHKAVNGLGMLVGQGARAFSIWNPDCFPEDTRKAFMAPSHDLSKVIEIMRKVALKELGKRH